MGGCGVLGGFCVFGGCGVLGGFCVFGGFGVLGGFCVFGDFGVLDGENGVLEAFGVFVRTGKAVLVDPCVAVADGNCTNVFVWAGKSVLVGTGPDVLVCTGNIVLVGAAAVEVLKGCFLGVDRIIVGLGRCCKVG